MSAEKETKGVFTRRNFLVGSSLGAGVLLGVGYLGRNVLRRYVYAMAEVAPTTMYAGDVRTPTLWFEVLADNRIILHSSKVEMGQGTFTGLAQIAADELEVDIGRINVVHAESDTGNVDGSGTGGSTSISSLWMPVRELAATLREMLKGEAAKLLGANVDDLETDDGTIAAGERVLTYGEVAASVENWEIPDIPPLKDVKNYKYVGKPVPRVDLEDKVLGKPIFGIDATMPDMLYGAVVRSESIGATFTGADTSRAEGMPGVVKIVREPDFVGVVAKSRMEAELAKNAIEATWRTDKVWQSSDIEEMIKVGRGEPMVIQTKGRAKDLLRGGEGVVSAEFTSPIGAHAQLEPNGAVAHVEGDRATVKVSTQVVNITRGEVAERLGLPKENVNIVPTYLGGGFGRRLHTPNAIQAAVLAKAAGKPVKCFFNRKEEFQNDTFRPPTHHVLKARLDGGGMIEAFEHNLSSGDVAFGSALFPSMLEPIVGSDIGAWRGGMIQYRGIPNLRSVSWRVKLPFATSWWRSLGLLANTFAIESFMDELAIKAGKDPVEFRLAHIQNDETGARLKGVISEAARRAGWKDGLRDGRAMGIAASTDAGTPCAHIAEVSVENRTIKVHKVTCALDPGLAVNPDQVIAQCEGAIIMGMSAVLYEEMTVKDGQLMPTIYGPYRMAMLKDAPREIDVVLLDSTGVPGPVGEPPLGPIGAAIANAVFRVTGQRLRSFPMKLG